MADISERTDVWFDSRKIEHVYLIVAKVLQTKQVIVQALQDEGKRTGEYAMIEWPLPGLEADSYQLRSKQVDVFAVLTGSERKVADFYGKTKDPFLAGGVRALTDPTNWSRIANYLMTPERYIAPVELNVLDINEAVGATSLAARFSESFIEFGFNNETLEAAPHIHPRDVREDYFDLIRQQRETLQQA